MENVNTLTNNGIKKFILRFDFQANAPELNFSEMMNSLSHLFDRVEQISTPNINLELKGEDPLVTKQNLVRYHLINADSKLMLILSPADTAFWIDSPSYKNNTTYKVLIPDILNAFLTLHPKNKIKRIGMRFINEYECKDINGIRKILSKDKANSVVSMLRNNYLTRVLCQEEYNYDDSKLRIVFGVPNKYYPSKLLNYDIVIDIDSYDESPDISIDNFGVIDNLNHRAYSAFTNSINVQFLEKLK